ncbi:MAG: aminotransferase class V-fold PLP-dependent enzyme [Clostridia bacterium]|nr:aminotransferase class V-fold PLP-dependent enzyme [Clostridia bacterium]
MIYLDNAATTFPKPPSVIRAAVQYMTKSGANCGRGGYKSALGSAELLWQAREAVANLIGSDNPQQLVFTKNATEALNLAIKGVLKSGGRVICSGTEHNSVMRPLTQQGAKITFLPLRADGCVDVHMLETLNPTDYDMVIINHASNVSGIINDVAYVAEWCKRGGVPCLIDASQSAGVLPLCADKWQVMLAFAGHKGPMGPQGTGGLFIPGNINPLPLMTGGTGSASENMTQPEDLPDKYESGTLNMPAIAGLYEGAKFILNEGPSNIHEKERYLRSILSDGLMNIQGVNVLYPENNATTSALSFYVDNRDTATLGALLDEQYGIAVRCGLHCAPMAHKSFGTFECGTVRVSPGYFNTKKDIDKFLYAIKKCTD